MTTQPTALTRRSATHHQPTLTQPAPEPVPPLHATAWDNALNPGDDGFAALCFDADPTSPARTRRFLQDTLADWHLQHILDETTAVASELVANAISHALDNRHANSEGATAWIALIHRRHSLICAVADPSPVPPVPREADALAEAGRGLCIVAALSESWGHSPPEAAGKTVWARITAQRV